MNRNLTLKDYFRGAEELHKASPTLRFPQAAFNYLYQVAPDLADAVWDTDKDPFFVKDEGYQNDPKWIKFVEYVKENW